MLDIDLSMQVSGKILVLATFAIGFTMAGGAWWYNFSQSRRTAQFWGADDAALIVGSEKVELLELVDYPDDGADDVVAKRAVSRAYDLTGKPGLVHLRHALTYDANFDWAGRREEFPSDDRGWNYALRFTKGDQRLDVVFSSDFKTLAKILIVPRDENYEKVTLHVLPCPSLGRVLVDYLGKKDVAALTPPAK